MTVSLERIRSNLTQRFPGLEQVGETVLRFERKSHERAFAIYYVDVSPQIPNTTALLNEYQERVVAKWYFQGKKSLQWSNYLYFVVDAAPPSETKVIVERDRRYARKFVVTEPELDTALSPPIYKVSDAVIKTDVLTTWTNILADANLDRAILNDETMPRRLELIEEHFGQKASAILKSHGTPRTVKQPFLKRVVLEKFRPFPQTREFDLGTVTLICGVNGSGKTSVLEAIELVYCGQTKRNPKASGAYAINAAYSDGKSEKANDKRPTSVFRDRNLAWYGQFEQKTSSLYQMFGRFNFLNTDAAVGLSEPKSQADLEDDLSKLLVGPDASKTWEVLGKTADKLDDKIKDLQSLRSQVDQELMAVNRQIAASSGLKQESGAIQQKLDGLLADASWTRPDGQITSSVTQLVESLSLFATVVREAIKCDWVEAPVTIDSLRRFTAEGVNRTESSTLKMKQLTVSQASERRLAQELSLNERAIHTLTKFLRLVEIGLPQRLTDRDQLVSLIAKHRQNIAGFDASVMQACLEAVKNQTVAEFAQSESTKLSESQHKLSSSKSHYADFTALREKSELLSQQLRNVAFEILKSAPDQDICPLCHFRHPEGELSRHMHAGLDPLIEARAAELLTAIRESESDLKNAEFSERTAQWAAQACKKFGQPTSISMGQLLQLVSNCDRELATLRNRHSLVTQELEQFEIAGSTAENYRQLLESLPPETANANPEEIKTQCIAMEHERTDKLKELNVARALSQSLLSEAAEAVKAKELTAKSIESALSELKEQQVTTESVLSRLASFISALPSPSSLPLSELLLTVETIRRVAGDYQATASREQSTVAVLAESTKRKDQIETQLKGLIPRIDRLTEAREILTKIQSEHSLSGAMDDALKLNRAAIEAIFSRIHSPAEFSGLGDKLTTLKRKGDAGTATLQQISTGQRAAFALSLFLAQNAQLRTAPPVILIDDPIAHVDDLNCLSFLDYLRDVVITGDRQVVFATANDKLAALFARKFDFLGEQEFKRYDLAR
jgi:DNA repair exonuclease SbcCD ATPase subunit